jgi:transcriptional regulator with XRE-family HTH domain
MKDRLLEFLRKENKSSAQLAEEIGVQASGISHILSGRNNPSLDFILKMLEKYQFLSSDWLLFGKGSMYKEPRMQSLFDFDSVNSRDSNEQKTKTELIKPEIEYQDIIKSKTIRDSVISQNNSNPEVIKIVWFYENNSFEEFLPRR